MAAREVDGKEIDEIQVNITERDDDGHEKWDHTANAVSETRE
ncbi:MAG: hypothetical protein U9Q03_06315 [Patescibacteria group bacterium]|nr:hypothetical protein [Patescibacteria group bacterium]